MHDSPKRTTVRRRTTTGLIATSAIAFVGLSVAVPAASAAPTEGWQCISPMQRYINPASADRPNVDLLNKNEVKLGITYGGGELQVQRGKKLTLAGAQLHAQLPGGDFAKGLWTRSFDAPANPGDPYKLGHHLLGHDRNNQFPIHGAVAIEATNTVEGTQRVAVQGIWTVNVNDPSFVSTGPKGGTSQDPSAATVTIDPTTLEIPATSWTPTGNGPVEFRVASHGNIGDRVTIFGRGYPGRADHNIGINVRPYGSVFLRPETDAYGLTADCVFGDIAVTNDAIPYSRLFGDVLPGVHQNGLPAGTPTNDGSDLGVGELRNPGWVHDRNMADYRPAYGSRGRYTIATAGRTPFATAALVTGAAPAEQTPVSVSSASLKRSKHGTLSLRLANGGTAKDVGAISIRTTSEVTVGGKKARYAVIRSADYRIDAGKARTFTLPVTSRLLSALRNRQSVNVTVTVKSDDAKTATTKSLRLTR